MNWTQADLDRLYVGETKAYGPMEPKPRRGRMNKLETRYSSHLEALKIQSGVICWYEFEAFKIRLADGAWYTPDFTVMRWDLKGGPPRVEFHECKGFWREAARIRIKVAADKYPFRFVAVTFDRKTGEWQYEHFTGRATA